jgi:hypothetical protein
MKIKYSKDYNFNKWLNEYDASRIRRGYDITVSSPLGSKWEEKDVNMQELSELIDKGYAIRINC